MDFKGFVKFFHLQDLVSDDHANVRFHLPFNGFVGSARPTDEAMYRAYMEKAMAFVEARNRRIDALQLQID